MVDRRNSCDDRARRLLSNNEGKVLEKNYTMIATGTKKNMLVLSLRLLFQLLVPLERNMADYVLYRIVFYWDGFTQGTTRGTSVEGFYTQLLNLLPEQRRSAAANLVFI